MPEMMSGGAMEKGSDTWNIAQSFTIIKILKPLADMDKHIRIALYGYDMIEESIQMPPELIVQRRIEAIRRVADGLREVVENTHFAMRKKEVPKLEKLDTEIKEVQKVLPAISRIVADQRTGEQHTVINETHFNICIERLREIRQDIHDPLNKSSLIFPSSDEIDIEKIKEQIMYGG